MWCFCPGTSSRCISSVIRTNDVWLMFKPVNDGIRMNDVWLMFINLLI